MKGTEDTRKIDRYIALDIHKEYVLAGGQTAGQEWVLPPRQISMAKFREWAIANFQEGDAVVIETTTNVWDIYDIVAPLVTRTVVAHAGAVRQIAEARVKTDKEDVKRLIRLLIADIVPEVWVPPLEVRELRGVISYRNRLVKMGTMVRNRLQSLLHRHNIILPKGKLLDASWWQEQKMSTLEKMQIQQELMMLEELDRHKREVDMELGRHCLREPWGRQAVRLLQLPGFGVVMTMIVLAAIGDIQRFESAKQLVGYAGLGAGVHTCTCVRCKCESACESLDVLQKDSGTCLIRLVSCGGLYHFGRCDGIWRSLANLSSFFATWLSSHPNCVDDCGRKRLGEGQQVEEHVGEGTKVFETICQAGHVFSGCWLSGLRLGAIMPDIRLELCDSGGLQYLRHPARWQFRPIGPFGS